MTVFDSNVAHVVSVKFPFPTVVAVPKVIAVFYVATSVLC